MLETLEREKPVRRTQLRQEYRTAFRPRRWTFLLRDQRICGKHFPKRKPLWALFLKTLRKKTIMFTSRLPLRDLLYTCKCWRCWLWGKGCSISTPETKICEQSKDKNYLPQTQPVTFLQSLSPATEIDESRCLTSVGSRESSPRIRINLSTSPSVAGLSQSLSLFRISESLFSWFPVE